MRSFIGAVLALAVVTTAAAQVPSVGPGRCVANCGDGSSSSRSSGGGYSPGAGPDLSALIQHLFTLPAGKKAMLEGWQALRAGRTSTAESKFREAIRHDRALSQAWEGLAEVLASQGDLSGALEAAIKAKSLAANGTPGPRRLVGRITRAMRAKAAPRPRPPPRRGPVVDPALQDQLAAKSAKVQQMAARLKARRAARKAGALQAFPQGSVRPEDAGLTPRVVERPGGPQLSASGQLRSAELHAERARRMVVTPATPHDRVSDRQMWEASRGFDSRGEGMGSLDPVVVEGRGR